MTSKLAKRGALIVFEGVDKVGKSTQSQLLVNALESQNIKAEYFRFPNRSTAIGSLINSYLKGNYKLDDHVIHLLFSANRWEFKDEMIYKLQNGISLIIDRYAFSGAAYSAAKSNLSLEWCKSSDSGLPKPDLVIYLTAPYETIFKRPGFGDELYESGHFIKKVQQNYYLLKEDNWKIQPADIGKHETHVEILKISKEVIKNVKSFIEPLWTTENDGQILPLTNRVTVINDF